MQKGYILAVQTKKSTEFKEMKEEKEKESKKEATDTLSALYLSTCLI